MATRTAKPASRKTVETFTHDEASRRNIPTAEFESMVAKSEQTPVRVAYERRNRDLDPQLVWRGKDEQDWSDLVVHAPPLYIQEKVHPKALIDDLQRRSEKKVEEQISLFADFNGVPDGDAKTEFYQHDAHWSNRMILGDSLHVMASLAEREGLRGKVQCIYLDPPYGIKFNSNFQWSTTSRDVKDGDVSHITREPEQVKAFRDTWRDGIHSYLTYLRDRLTVARDLLTDSGSVFVQIGDENVHRIRSLMDEVFGADNRVSIITLKKTAGQDERLLNNVADYILWFAKAKGSVKYREPLTLRSLNYSELGQYTRIQKSDGARDGIRRADFDETGELQSSGRPFRLVIGTSSGHGGNRPYPVEFESRSYLPTANRHWSTHANGFRRLIAADRISTSGATLAYVRFFDDFVAQTPNNVWADIGTVTDKMYVVQTGPAVIQRCMLMTTDPGDLVLDPTCGSGTTAYVAEQWGRRWITIDTSRVALALARARIMGARYPYYQLADKQFKSLRQGFNYERVPHITLKSIANNAEIDVIWGKYQLTLEPLRQKLNELVNQQWEEWQIPRCWTDVWTEEAHAAHAEWWRLRIARQKEIDASIAAKADYEYLYDKPYEDKSKVRVAGPFTVESLSPHRVLAVNENDELVEAKLSGEGKDAADFVSVILENLKTAGVQQAHKEDKIVLSSLTPWPGEYICAEGRYLEGETEKRAGIFIGPEFGTVQREDLVVAAREAGDADFDVLISCAFNYDAHSSGFHKLGRIPVLKARMNADLHMAVDLKNTGKGNLFVIFGEPDIQISPAGDGEFQVKILGVDVFHPNTGEVRSDGAEGIACWFLDTDYNEESFFVRHAYFLGQNDPYKALKTTLKAEIDEEAWATLRSDTSRPFPRPSSGRIAVKVINHLGDEVMKVFRVA